MRITFIPTSGKGAASRARCGSRQDLAARERLAAGFDASKGWAGSLTFRAGCRAFVEGGRRDHTQSAYGRKDIFEFYEGSGAGYLSWSKVQNRFSDEKFTKEYSDVPSDVDSTPAIIREWKNRFCYWNNLVNDIYGKEGSIYLVVLAERVSVGMAYVARPGDRYGRGRCVDDPYKSVVSIATAAYREVVADQGDVEYDSDNAFKKPMFPRIGHRSVRNAYDVTTRLACDNAYEIVAQKYEHEMSHVPAALETSLKYDGVLTNIDKGRAPDKGEPLLGMQVSDGETFGTAFKRSAINEANRDQEVFGWSAAAASSNTADAFSATFEDNILKEEYFTPDVIEEHFAGIKPGNSKVDFFGFTPIDPVAASDWSYDSPNWEREYNEKLYRRD